MSNPFSVYLNRGKQFTAQEVSPSPHPAADVRKDVDRIAKVVQLEDDEDLLGIAEGIAEQPSPRHILLASLPWGARSSDERRDKIHALFEGLMCNGLVESAAMLSAFQPFIELKYVHRHAKKVLLEDAPQINASHIQSAGGYSLRSYQLDGVQFLLNNFHKGMSSILADDMGLGKTAQVAAFLQALHSLHGVRGPHLIVVPLTSLTNWVREMTRWAPHLEVIKYHGMKKFRDDLMISCDLTSTIVITTPSTLYNDRGSFRKRAWAVMAVDEAHLLRNDSTNIVGLCSRMSAVFRLSITGTPFQNTISELWTQMSFLYPYIASRRPNCDNEKETMNAATALLSYIMIRRTKGSLELGIPPRIDEPTMMIEPTELQRDLLEYLGKISNGDDNKQIRRHFMDLRKICNHPMLLKLLADSKRERIRQTADLTMGIRRLYSAGIALSEEDLLYPSAKMIKLDSMLSQMKSGGHRVLIFSNFTSQLDLLEGLCVFRGYSYERLDGECNRVERELSMLRFNAPSSKIFAFLVTTTAGGVGVTLTGADRVVIFDCHFNPQMDRQAADRAHRIGQTRTVRVYRMCLQGTAEESIQQIALRKAAVGDMVLDGSTVKSESTFFSIDDIRRLLQGTFAPKSRSSTADPHYHRLFSDLGTILEFGKEDDSEPEPRSGRVTYDMFRSNSCFSCGEASNGPMRYCSTCPKGYHTACLDLDGPTNNNWTCPRHSCTLCEKSTATDGSLFLCSSCPQSYCFDCLDERYLLMDESGLRLRDVSPFYHGMEKEGVEPKRSTYYITCLRCAGIESRSDTVSYVESEEEN